MLAADVVLVGLSYYLAYLIRFEGKIPQEYATLFSNSILPIIIIKMICFFLFDLYRGMWRYTSLVDFLNVFKAAVISSFGLVLIFLFWVDFRGFSRSVLILDFLLTLLFIAGIRLGIRLYLSRGQRAFSLNDLRKDGKARRLLLIGAGNTGEHVLREMMDNPAIQMLPIGFLDDDKTKLGMAIHGVPVLGNVDQIDKIRVDYDEILISAPSATGKQMKRIMAACERTGKPVKTMPPLGELINGSISMKMIRTVSIEDLIGREEVCQDEEYIKGYILGKRVMITGAGGSIGSELARQLGRFDPKSVALVDFSEFNLYRVELECRERFKRLEVRSYLVDLRNIQTTRRMFKDFKPDVVFHAAAYKHVPMQEINPWEAIHNNVLSMRHLVKCSIDGGVEKFVLVSTDKAVRPTSIMGTTKRICEMIASSTDGIAKTIFISVRFGNVVGSSGSVIPLFQQQIARGGPVTVTHPEIIRYFMSIPEAAQLILQAGAMGRGKEIFILKMGEPIKIADLARDLIRLNHLEPDQDIPIKFTGLRPGEKLYEELITEGEGIVSTNHEKILVLQLNHSYNYEDLSAHIDELIHIADTFNTTAIKDKLKEIVPEYTPQ